MLLIKEEYHLSSILIMATKTVCFWPTHLLMKVN